MSCHRMMKSVIGGYTLHHKYSSSAAQLSLGVFFLGSFLSGSFMTVWIRTNFISFHLHLCYNKLKLLVKKMNAFAYFYKVFLQKCRDGFVGL